MGEKRVLIVTGRYEKIKAICKFIADGAERCGLDETAVFHVELACDEACTNIIEHAYGAEDVGIIEASWQIEGNQFKITIHDNGQSFNPDDVSTLIPPPSSPVDELQVGGLGVHFMRKLMDEVHFDFDESKGNTLVMVKRIPEERET
jgi:serine/threonine-protein kinase RsbW